MILPFVFRNYQGTSRHSIKNSNTYTVVKVNKNLKKNKHTQILRAKFYKNLGSNELKNNKRR